MRGGVKEKTDERRREYSWARQRCRSLPAQMARKPHYAILP